MPKVIKDFRDSGNKKYHIVHFRWYNRRRRRLESRGFGVYRNNKEFIRGKLPRAKARAIVKLLNSAEANPIEYINPRRVASPNYR